MPIGFRAARESKGKISGSLSEADRFQDIAGRLNILFNGRDILFNR